MNNIWHDDKGRPHLIDDDGYIEARGFMPVDPAQKIEVDGLIDRAGNFNWNQISSDVVLRFKIWEGR